MRIARVALDVPLDEAFDFRLPEGLEAALGALVIVPFGRTRKVGVVVEHADASDVAPERLRDVESVVEDVPPFTDADLDLFRFCARYYQRPLGEVVATGMPPRLRQVKRRPIEPSPPRSGPPSFVSQHPLTPAQSEAIASVLAGRDRFHPVLLEGVTGSGKTEVYLHLIADALARGRQALMLVPEIGLTPQFEEHVRSRFPGATMLTAHSNLAEGERARAWLAARTGAAHVILGTRLAVLTPFDALGLVVVDEEHDPSYKQQDGMRYSARDVAVLRAQRLGIPVVLGSATPSLESFWNAREGRYLRMQLPARAAAGAGMPAVRTLDTRADRPQEGLSHGLLLALRKRLERGEQSLIFLNRRGYAPVLFCRDCQWHSSCTRCSANLVLHRQEGELRCHHCGHRERVPSSCPDCGSVSVARHGAGTERLEHELMTSLGTKDFPVLRLDADAAGLDARAAILERFHAAPSGVLIGTQMVAKGHDFPDVGLGVVVDADQTLRFPDFRSEERTFALITQLAGRTGRGGSGRVLVQTMEPSARPIALAAQHDSETFVRGELRRRKALAYPPFATLIRVICASVDADAAYGASRALAERINAARQRPDQLAVLGPAPLFMLRGKARQQLVVKAPERHAAVAAVREAVDAVSGDRAHREVALSVDVDPQ